MFLFCISGLDAICIAAQIDAPELIPIGNPSICATVLAISIASSEVTSITSLTNDLSYKGGMKPAPIPKILWLPAGLPLRTAL